MYVNYTNPTINPHNIYAYLRCYESEIIIVAVNFSGNRYLCDLAIPQHAFDILGIPQGTYPATELLTGKRGKKMLTATDPFSIELEGNNAKIVENQVANKKDNKNLK